MKINSSSLLKSGIIFFSALAVVKFSFARNSQQYYQIKVYHLANQAQETTVDHYLQEAYLPALHRAGIAKVGVFKPVGQDTTSDRRIYVLIPFNSLKEFAALTEKLQQDKKYLTAGAEYINAAYDNPPYERLETILLKAFPLAPHIMETALSNPKQERIYELRSYENPTEKYHVNKVHMFNQGGETGIFKKINANAIFYGSVIAGSHMPNLMYMTSYANMDDRDAHWKAFGSDSTWKRISGMDKYKNNVSHIDDTFLHPTKYSDL